MRATYRRGMQIKGLLDQKGINSFIPMRYEIHLKMDTGDVNLFL